MVRRYISSKMGMVLLGIWLILTGLLPLVPITFPWIVMNVLAITAGVLIIAGR